MASARPFQDKVIAITGAASGMGLATAHYLAVRGASLSVAEIQDDLLEAAARSVKNAQPDVNILVTVIDVRKPSEVDSWIASTISAFGKLDGCANLAGVVGRTNRVSNVAELEDEEWNYIMAVNLNGVFHCVRAELKYLAKGGSIVNAASVAGLVGSPQSAAYSASKHGVVGLTRSVAKELENLSIRVNCICPGVINTPMVEHIEKDGELIVPAVFKRKGTVEEIAALIGFLLGDESKFITGAAYTIDGGWVC